MTIQFPRKGVAESRLLTSGSSLVRRVVQAQDDPAKRRIRAWLRELDDEQLSSIGLTREDINVPLSSFVQAQRLARVERGFVIKACVRGTMRRFVEWLRVLGILSIRLARDLAAKRVLRSAIRELHQLDDRMLADIGISRGEIESAVRNGLPTRVTHTGASHHARRDTSSADLALFRNTPYRQGATPLLFRQSD
jgi:uncharacterized protein YjiS (DUF1127 family)